MGAPLNARRGDLGYRPQLASDSRRDQDVGVDRLLARPPRSACTGLPGTRGR
jgi:hypothetical protein